MRLGIMQPYLFPYIGYWQLINTVDKYIIYDDVNFIKGGWINRNRILMNGTDKLINLQMHNASPNKLINEVELLGNTIYNNKLIKTLESCYKKAPFFCEVYPLIERVINNNESNLARYLEYCIKKVCDYLSITTKIVVSSEIRKNNELCGQDKVINICKTLGADEYFNAIGGQSLYSREDFNAAGIQLRFLKTGDIQYKQFKNEFIPNLSIIDVMMFNSQEQMKELLETYEII